MTKIPASAVVFYGLRLWAKRAFAGSLGSLEAAELIL
jgi:energy-converting hydrogenase Eha subunit B